MWAWLGGTRPTRAEREDAAERAEHAAYRSAVRAWACDVLGGTDRAEAPTSEVLAAYLLAVGA